MKTVITVSYTHLAERLDKMGIENFVPVQQEVHQWSDRRKVVESVLLPMMVFVHADPKERKEVLSFSTVSRYMVMRGESSPTTVSYTHLDVYKRQIHDSIVPFMIFSFLHSNRTYRFSLPNCNILRAHIPAD